ncbi:hypothetical protein ACEWY4_018881 [Coilia grayii]|uniref:EGF-like domain-containing protein n=1 Tax=Coilia grayii TaxID=363190 RepID=A0ABD1JFR0_9TELE
MTHHLSRVGEPAVPEVSSVSNKLSALPPPLSIAQPGHHYKACGEHNVSNNSLSWTMLQTFNTAGPIFTGENVIAMETMESAPPANYERESAPNGCKCNLHANSCVFDKDKLSCECEHNTTGPDCGRCKRNYQGRAWSAGSYLPIPKGTANICVPPLSGGPVIRQNVSSLGVANRNQARVCDNEMLRCQNGGVCLNNLRCQCPAGFTGLLCEKAQCEGEAGGCNGPDSGAPSTFSKHPALTSLLLPLVLTLAPVLLGEACWSSSV